MGQSPIPRYLGNRQIGRNKRLILLPLIFKVKGKGKGQGRLVFSKSPRKSRVRPFVCSKKTFSCYFWRSCGGQYPIAGAAKPASSTRAGSVCRAQHRGGGMCDRDCWKLSGSSAQAISENSPITCRRTYTRPRFGSFLASSLLIETMFISTTHPNSCRERIRMAGLQSLLILHMLLWRAHHTRMTKQKNLSILHAMLPVSLSEGKYSRKLCLPQKVAFMCRAQHLLQRVHSIARMAKFVSSARDTDSHFPRGRMFSPFCAYQTRRQQFFPKAHVPPFCAHRTHFLPALPHFYVPVKGVWGLGPHG